MITTLTGPNHFLVMEKLRQLTDDFIKKNGDMALEKLDGAEASTERMREALQSPAFLSPGKLVVLKDAGQAKDFAEQLTDIIETIPETTDVIIVESKLDKRLSYYKTLKAKTDFQEFSELDGPALASWLVERVKASGGTLGRPDAQYLIERVGANQELLARELEKLLLYDPEISGAAINELTEPAPQSTIFELLDSAFSGNRAKTMRLYDEQRALKVEPQQIIAMLAWQLHVLAVVKAAGERSGQDIAREAKLNPYVVRKTQAIAIKLSLSEVKKIVHRAKDLDITLKSQSIDADEALRYFLLTLTS